MYSPFFDSFFSPPTIVVVSEERLKEVDERLTQLREYRQALAKELAPAEKTGKDLDKLDEAASDV